MIIDRQLYKSFFTEMQNAKIQMSATINLQKTRKKKNAMI